MNITFFQSRLIFSCANSNLRLLCVLFNIGLYIALEYFNGMLPLLATLYIVRALTLIVPLLFSSNFLYTSFAVAFLLTKCSFTHFACLAESFLGLPTRALDLDFGCGFYQKYRVLLLIFINLHTCATDYPSESFSKASCLIAGLCIVK